MQLLKMLLLIYIGICERAVLSTALAPQLTSVTPGQSLHHPALQLSLCETEITTVTHLSKAGWNLLIIRVRN